MTRTIVVDEPFDRDWSFAADYAHRSWAGDEGFFVRLAPGDARTVDELDLPPSTTQLLLLCHGESRQSGELTSLPKLRELGLPARWSKAPSFEAAKARGVQVYSPRNEGFWGQSVAEFGLGLTLAGLRRIPQTHRALVDDLSVWTYAPPAGEGRPSARAGQFGDDPAFTAGTVAGKRVRVVGMGNIGARYASFCAMLGADVAAWDAVAPDPAFHRSNTRRVLRLPDLVKDAEIFAPMLPHLPATERIVTAELVDTLPAGCLVVCVTRMHIVDASALRRRVLADELSLAADVFDVEPLPLDDPLVGRHNVVHTPHNAGRTADANRAYVDAIVEQFSAPEGVL